jgi:gliding motility-associated-like protein
MKRITLVFLISIASHFGLFAACPGIQMSGQQVSCYGGGNGQATVSINTPSSGNYTYTWSNGTIASGSAVSTISNLSAGTYTVSVRDNVSGCTVTGAYVVGQPDPLSITGSVTNVNCRGDLTGQIDISVIGGLTPYSYSWTTNGFSTSVATSQDISAVGAGVYNVIVSTPTAGCSDTATFTVTQPAEALQASAVVTNASCFGSLTGSINLSVWGGTSPYTYSWTNGALTQDINNVSSGSYTVTITDARGCSIDRDYLINQPAILGGSISTSPVVCFGDNTGSIEVSVTGGTGPFNYSWSNSSTLFATNSSVLSNVPADNYQVVITDAQNCQLTLNGTITQPSQLMLTTSSTNVNCNGGSDGTVSSVVSGGISPYAYQWTNSIGFPVGSVDNLINLVADTYTLLITDANGCTETSQETVSEPPSPITVTSSKVDVLCNADATGSIMLVVTGGTAPYTYLWSNGSITSSISNLLAVSYNYQVTDANGCVETGTVEIFEPAAPLLVVPTIQDVSCNGFSDGSITLTVSGGTPGYAYEWQNSQFLLSQTGGSLIGFPADDYRFEVTDANGCNVVDTLTIEEPTLLESTISGVDILCKGDSTGSVAIVVSGGVLPYSYTWNTGDVVSSVSNLPAGSYNVTVVDGNNCILTNSIVLTEPQDSLSFTFVTEDVLCNDGSNGSIALTVAGGTSPYVYDWSNGATSPLLTSLTAGVYTFEVTDNNGCLIGDSIEIFQPDPLVMNETITNVTCFGFSDGLIDIQPTGGTMPYSYAWFNSTFALSSMNQDLIGYPADVYQVIITDTNDCVYESFFEITEPDLLEISFSFNPISCFDGADGNVFVDVQGGTTAYNFNWSDGSANQDLTNVPFGDYQLIVTDAQNCMDSIEVTLDQPEAVTMTFTSQEVSCVDQFDGIAEVFPAGGNGGYIYDWSNGEINSLNEGLSNQWYSVVITDILGCTGTDSVFIDRNLIGCIDPVNAFSPNGDNYNDTWIIDNIQLYPKMQMQIFNKWGVLVHNLEGDYLPWDGTQNERPLPSEVYYYILMLNNEENDVLTGNITIIR